MPYMNCGFCRNAGKEWTNHCLMDKKGNVTCMFLKQHSCPYCNIKGHSKTFCPEIKAKEQRKDFLYHAAHLIIHGTLHALGYDHVKPREAQHMESLEIRILATMGIDNPYLITEK